MPSQRFSVLKAGSAYREIRERSGDFDRMLIELLAEPGQAWDVYDVEHGQFPREPADYDGFVITGSRYSATDNLPWVKELCALVTAIRGRGQALLGICFGHQVLAQALGGEVRPSPLGWDVGVRSVQLTLAGQQAAALAAARTAAPQPVRVFQLHQDIVTRLPPGAAHLASSDHTPHEMFSLGACILGVQGHPEFDADVIRVALAKLGAASLLPQERIAQCEATLVQKPHRDFLRHWLRAFLRTGRRQDAA